MRNPSLHSSGKGLRMIVPVSLIVLLRGFPCFHQGLCTLVLSFSIAADIVQPPTDITGFLDNTAVFKCEVDGGLAGWRVNGTYYNDLSPEIRSDLDADQEDGAGGNEILTLTIPGKTKYNETRVQCVVFGGASKESENATMTVQGIPCISR